MSENDNLTKEVLFERIAESWQALNDQLDQLSDQEMTWQRDAAGWSVKDHVAHLAAWENTALYLLEGRPRYFALGIDEDTYRRGNLDEINEDLFHQYAGMSAHEALDRLRMVHEKMMDILEPMTEADFHRPVGYYLRQRRKDQDPRPVIDVVYANTAEHYNEHMAWIQALLKQEDADEEE